MYKGTYEQEMAMGIDEEFEFNELKEYNFKEFFEQNNIYLNQYFSDFETLTKKLSIALDTFDFINGELLSQEKDFIEKYILNIKTRVNHISKLLNNVRYTLPYKGQEDSEFIEKEKSEIKKVLAKRYVDGDNKSNMLLYMKKLNSRMIENI